MTIEHLPRSSRQRLGSKFLAVVIGLGLAALIAELGLRGWKSHLGRSDQLDPGLIQREPAQGWRMSPGWNGGHAHHDFSVIYSVDSAGFRRDPMFQSGASNWVAVVGDSFTFGLGVNDGETFVSRLNGLQRGQFVNFGVPGYSTDQEVLLCESEVLPRRPSELLLVVYLGNDLLDNLRFIPLQVGAPKPRFVVTHQELVLLPAPNRGTPPDPPDPNPAYAVLGPGSRYAWRQKLEERSSVAGLLSRMVGAPDLAPEFEDRFQPELDLFTRLLRRLKTAAGKHEVPVRLVLLGSGALVHQPQSVSGQYQVFFQQKLHHIAQAEGIPVIDLAELMRQKRQQGAVRELWFHPNEGHLTPAGHVVAAELLAEALRGRR
jgi:GDSL-like Lipase/Acylhydrolase family